MISPDYGSKIILIGKALGMNLREFAKALPVSYSTIRNYTENGVMPPMDFIRKLLELAPNINLMWLFFDQGDMFNEDIEKRIVEMVLRENELHRKLEAERDRNLKVDAGELMEVLRRNHTMLGMMENNYSQIKEDLSALTKKVSVNA